MQQPFILRGCFFMIFFNCDRYSTSYTIGVTSWVHLRLLKKELMRYPLIKPNYYYSLFKEITNFIKKPTVDIQNKKSTKIKIYDTIGLYVLKMICLIPIVLFFALIYDPKNLVSQSMSERFSPISFLLVGGVILPTVEEVAFRLALKFKPIYLALSSGVFLYYFLTKAIFHTKISAIDESSYIRIGSALILIVAFYLMLNIGAIRKKLTQVWDKYFHLLYYISCITFAWIHISKYELIWLNIVLLPILTLPQLMSALISGYTRVVFGFQYPLLFHVATNVLAISISLLPFAD